MKNYKEYQQAKCELLGGIIGGLRVMVWDADSGSPLPAQARDEIYTSNAREAIRQYDALIAEGYK